MTNLGGYPAGVSDSDFDDDPCGLAAEDQRVIEEAQEAEELAIIEREYLAAAITVCGICGFSLTACECSPGGADDFLIDSAMLMGLG